jgi:nitronate monooxygenase
MTKPAGQQHGIRPVPVWPHELRAPVLVAPMFAVSGPQLVIASCRAGLMGSFPTRNARTVDELARWLDEIRTGLAGLENPQWAVSMIAQSSYARFDQELELIAEYRPNVVMTALGSPRRVIERVRGYGGAVFAEVTSVEHALKAVYAGADGLVLVCRGARASEGQLSAPAFVAEVRSFFDGPLVVSGSISTGAEVRGAEVLGADLVCLGARFNACPESLVDDRYRSLVRHATTEDLAATAAMTGVPCSWLFESFGNAGFRDEQRVPAVSRVVDEIVVEYHAARSAEENHWDLARTPWEAELSETAGGPYRRTQVPVRRVGA